MVRIQVSTWTTSQKDHVNKVLSHIRITKTYSEGLQTFCLRDSLCKRSHLTHLVVIWSCYEDGMTMILSSSKTVRSWSNGSKWQTTWMLGMWDGSESKICCRVKIVSLHAFSLFRSENCELQVFLIALRKPCNTHLG